MSARTCQLCGRPLSRIWVGAGGDFCSREHRNQYGLRLGMDRLQEANKVATLMRRRENLKSVMPTQAESLSSLQRRGFNEALRLSEPAAPSQQMRAIPASLDAHIRGGGEFFQPQARGPKERHVARTCGYLRGAGQATDAVLPPLREYLMPVTVPAARPPRLWDGARSLKVRRRGSRCRGAAPRAPCSRPNRIASRSAAPPTSATRPRRFGWTCRNMRAARCRRKPPSRCCPPSGNCAI